MEYSAGSPPNTSCSADAPSGIGILATVNVAAPFFQRCAECKMGSAAKRKYRERLWRRTLRRPQFLCPLPLWERATRSFDEEEWERGTPHPIMHVERAAMP